MISYYKNTIIVRKDHLCVNIKEISTYKKISVSYTNGSSSRRNEIFPREYDKNTPNQTKK